MIIMLAPGSQPYMTFGGVPSGSTYTSDAYGLLFVGGASDQIYLEGFSCKTLQPMGDWGSRGFGSLSDLYAADVSLQLPQWTVASVFLDATSSNNGTWYKSGSGFGSGNWTQGSSQTLATLYAGLTAEIVAIGSDEHMAALGSTTTSATGNVNVASPGSTFDGVTLTNVGADTVFLYLQTNKAENGVYVWNGAVSPLTRRADANTAALLSGIVVTIGGGSTMAGRRYQLPIPVASIIVGASALNFVPFNWNYNGPPVRAADFASLANADAVAVAKNTWVDFSDMGVVATTGDLTLLAPWRKFGGNGIVDSGTYALTGDFWAPPNVAMFSATATGLITISNREPRWAKWFNTTGNGANDSSGADDTQPLKNWIASSPCGTYNGILLHAPLYIGAGSFRYTSKLTFTDSAAHEGQINVKGMGLGSTNFLPDFVNDDAILIAAVGASTFEGFSVGATARRQGGTSGGGINCTSQLNTTTQSRITLSQIQVNSQKGDGFFFTDPELLSGYELWSGGNGGAGFHLFTSTSRGVNDYLRQCRSSGNASYGYLIDGALQIVVLEECESLNDFTAQGGYAIGMLGSPVTCHFLHMDVEQSAFGNNNSAILLGGSGGHKLVGGIFRVFDNNGIEIRSSNNQVEFPRFQSAGGNMNVGVNILTGSKNNVRLLSSLMTQLNTYYEMPAGNASNNVYMDGARTYSPFTATWNATLVIALASGYDQQVTATANTTFGSPTLPTGVTAVSGSGGSFDWTLRLTSSGGAWTFTQGGNVVGTFTNGVSGKRSICYMHYDQGANTHVLQSQSPWF